MSFGNDFVVRKFQKKYLIFTCMYRQSNHFICCTLYVITSTRLTFVVPSCVVAPLTVAVLSYSVTSLTVVVFLQLVFGVDVNCYRNTLRSAYAYVHVVVTHIL